MNKHNNHIKELSAEAMEDINSISASKFSTINAHSKKINSEDLPPLEDLPMGIRKNLDESKFSALSDDEDVGDIIEINVGSDIPEEDIPHFSALDDAPVEPALPPFMNASVPNAQDPFSDPAFLAAQTAKPTFYQQGIQQQSPQERPMQQIQQPIELPLDPLPPQEQDLGYVPPGISQPYEQRLDKRDRFHIEKEEIERRTQEIWGNSEPVEQRGSNYATGGIPDSNNDAQIHTHITNSPIEPIAKPSFSLAPESSKATVAPAANAGPSTLINGYKYDLQNKSQAEVRQGLDRIIQKTSQNMKPHNVERNGGSIVAADMYKGSRYEANAKSKNNQQINTKISGLGLRKAPESTRDPDSLVNTVIMHGTPKQSTPLNFNSRSHGSSVTASQLKNTGKNTKTILSDSKGRIIEDKKPHIPSTVAPHKSNTKAQAIDFSFASKSTNITSTAQESTPVTLTEREPHTPVISLDSMLQPVETAPKEIKSVIKNTKSNVNVNISDFDFDKNAKRSREEQIDELDNLLSSLEDIEASKKEVRPKLFDVPDLFESTKELPKEQGPLKIKPDFYTTSDNKPTILDINPLENPPSVNNKVDDKNLDVELPELTSDKNQQSSESLSELQELGHALRSITDSLSAAQKSQQDSNETTSSGVVAPIDAFSNLVASADERFSTGGETTTNTTTATTTNNAAVDEPSAAAQDNEELSVSAYIAQAQSALMQCSYLGHSGLDLGTIERFNLGYDGSYQIEDGSWWQALIVPLSEHSFVAYNGDTLLTSTTGEPERRYVCQCDCLNLQLLNGQELEDPIFICAYELDALALESLGVQALSLGSPYNVMTVLNCLQNLCNSRDLRQIFKAPCYLCLPSNALWQGALDALMAAFNTLQLEAHPLDLTNSCPTIYQALALNKKSLLKQLLSIQDHYSAKPTPFTIASSMPPSSAGLVLNLESLVKLELAPTLYALSASSIELSRLVMASLVMSKFSPLVYAGSTMQWQMLCSLLGGNHEFSPQKNSPFLQLVGYKAKFLSMPWEMSLAKIDEHIVQGLQAQKNSSEGSCAFMIDTFGYDNSLCTSLAPRFAQLAMEFNTPIVAWCSQEQKTIFSGNAFQSIEMSQGSPNQIIFKTVDSACVQHMFTTAN